jgi:signal transduction histidine kinase
VQKKQSVEQSQNDLVVMSNRLKPIVKLNEDGNYSRVKDLGKTLGYEMIILKDNKVVVNTTDLTKLDVLGLIKNRNESTYKDYSFLITKVDLSTRFILFTKPVNLEIQSKTNRFYMIILIIMSFVFITLLSKILDKWYINPINKITESIKSNERIENIKNGDILPIVVSYNELFELKEKNKEAQKKFYEESSHNLKTPIMNISGYVEGLLDGIFKDEKTIYTILLKESDKLKNIVNNLLYLSKLDSLEKSELKIERIDIKKELYDLFPNVDKNVLKINSSMEYINFNREFFIKIVENLISNALRYCKENVIITINENIDEFSISVCDDGSGIDPSIEKIMFDKFVKGQNGQSGLGLSIVKSIVDELNGKISYSRIELSCFEIKIPNKVNI